MLAKTLCISLFSRILNPDYPIMERYYKIIQSLLENNCMFNWKSSALNWRKFFSSWNSFWRLKDLLVRRLKYLPIPASCYHIRLVWPFDFYWHWICCATHAHIIRGRPAWPASSLFALRANYSLVSGMIDWVIEYEFQENPSHSVLAKASSWIFF